LSLSGRLKAIFLSRTFLLFCLVFIIYNVNFRSLATSDTYPATLLPLSIIYEFNLDLNEYAFYFKSGLPYFITDYNGHLYSNYSLMPSITAVPVYFLPALAGLVPLDKDILFYAKLSASIMAALSVVLVYLTLLRLRAGKSFSLFLALSFALATSTWTINSQALWEHTSGSLYLAASLYFIVSASKDRRYLVLCGAASALAVASRMNNLIMVLSILAYVILKHRKDLWLFLIFPVIIGVWFFMMNYLHFGSILGGAGELMKQPPTRQGIEGGMSGSFTEGFIGILFSPSRGLFIFSPWLIFSFAAIVYVWVKTNNLLFRCLSVGVVVTILFFSQFSTWWGGLCYGPRYLSDFLPFLAVFPFFVKESLRRYKALGAALCLLVLFSLFVQVVGAFNFNTDWYHNPTNVDIDHARLWDWRDSEISRALGNGPAEPVFIDYLFGGSEKE
jgi:hypothetical protein